ncbi:hypothetical protein [Hydrogenophaga pseudoflava]|uniref:hypothetical protein n=1 Tax=Hydrogenophaga pseudoflava TaxID=47421 RepID=UPI0010574DB0|nr:hypothetical protein [Hydrogenophaga pseudoflava]
MPYVIGFSKPVQIADADLYINDCCIGGDIVLERLLPALRDHYGNSLQADQEDWGWFIWFEELGTKLAVDIHTEDAERGEFKIHLTASRSRFFFGPKIQDTPELEQLRDLILLQLQSWQVDGLNTELVDKKYMPI